jgi:hypothetical protein
LLLEICFSYFVGLDGVTNSVHSYDIDTKKWTRFVHSFIHSTVFQIHFIFASLIDWIATTHVTNSVCLVLWCSGLNLQETRRLLGLLMPQRRLAPWLFFRCDYGIIVWWDCLLLIWFVLIRCYDLTYLFDLFCLTRVG